MKSRDFVYWLQGYIELNEAQPVETMRSSPTTEQWRLIKNHLALVFKHEIDPEGGDSEQQSKLNQIHAGKPEIGGHFEGRPDILLRC